MLGASGMDPLSMLIDTGADFLPVPGPLRDAAAAAARQMVNPDMLPPEARAALDAAQHNMEAQAAAAAQGAQKAAAAVRPALHFPKDLQKKRMRRGTKIALAVGGTVLVGGAIVAKVLL